MREYIKCNKQAAIMLLRRGNDEDCARADAIDAHNTAIAERAYKAVSSGSAEYAYIRAGNRLIAYTKSLRGPFVQASYFIDINGDWLATMHTDITDTMAMERTFIPGKYITTKAV